MPSSAGHVILQHWSNGDAKWSGGPPAQDALLTVSYVKAYFNTSSGEHASRWRKGCAEAQGGAVCSVADVVAGNGSTGGRFLSDDGAGGASHDDGGGDESGGRALRAAGGTRAQPAVPAATATAVVAAMVRGGGW